LANRVIREQDFPFQFKPSSFRRALIVTISMLRPAFLRMERISELLRVSLRLPERRYWSVIACLFLKMSVAAACNLALLTSGRLVSRELDVPRE